MNLSGVSGMINFSFPIVLLQISVLTAHGGASGSEPADSAPPCRVVILKLGQLRNEVLDSELTAECIETWAANLVPPARRPAGASVQGRHDSTDWSAVAGRFATMEISEEAEQLPWGEDTWITELEPYTGMDRYAAHHGLPRRVSAMGGAIRQPRNRVNSENIYETVDELQQEPYTHRNPGRQPESLFSIRGPVQTRRPQIEFACRRGSRAPRSARSDLRSSSLPRHRQNLTTAGKRLPPSVPKREVDPINTNTPGDTSLQESSSSLSVCTCATPRRPQRLPLKPSPRHSQLMKRWKWLLSLGRFKSTKGKSLFADESGCTPILVAVRELPNGDGNRSPAARTSRADTTR